MNLPPISVPAFRFGTSVEGTGGSAKVLVLNKGVDHLWPQVHCADQKACLKSIVTEGKASRLPSETESNVFESGHGAGPCSTEDQ